MKLTTRAHTKKIQVGNVQIGNQNNVIVQSMTNTKTSDIDKTLKQINELVKSGCELVRVALFDDQDVKALSEITKQSPIPVIADIHFNYKYALDAIDAGAAKIRLNPGNISNPEHLKLIVAKAKEKNIPIRVGVNSGSLSDDIVKKYGVTAEGMLEQLDRYLKLFNDLDFDNIILSLKSSDPLLTIEAYSLAAQKYNYPLHLGVTESGMGDEGIIKTVAGLSPLLNLGIGDTVRVSLSGNPVEEIPVARKLLNVFKIRHDMVDIVACPTCGRLNYDMLPIVNKLKAYTKDLNIPIKIAILGCVVNGIGEGKEADIGIAGGNGQGIVFKNGKIYKTVKEDQLWNELKDLIDMYKLKTTFSR